MSQLTRVIESASIWRIFVNANFGKYILNSLTEIVFLDEKASFKNLVYLYNEIIIYIPPRPWPDLKLRNAGLTYLEM